MKKIIFLTVIIISSLFLSGCLIFHKVSYNIELDNAKAGKVTVVISDIRSDATTETEFEEDKERLFGMILESEEFIQSMGEEGKEIINRELFLTGDTLNGRVEYKFNDINNIEGIVAEAGFYYLTLPLEDSVLTTNGEIIRSKNFKRIIWEAGTRNLHFEMLSFSFDRHEYRKLAPFYNKK
jgi:hypothetical protein